MLVYSLHYERNARVLWLIEIKPMCSTEPCKAKMIDVFLNFFHINLSNSHRGYIIEKVTITNTLRPRTSIRQSQKSDILLLL